MMKKGFTLIEVLVSIAIFSVVILIAIGSIISILDADRKSQSISTTVNNLNVALESMIRDMRTGSGYAINNPSSISFKDKDGNDVIYCLDDASRDCLSPYGYTTATTTNQIVKLRKDYSVWGPITGSDVTIDTMTFTVRGNNSGGASDKLPPIVLLHITGHAGVNKSKSDFNIQTLITQRKLDTKDFP